MSGKNIGIIESQRLPAKINVTLAEDYKVTTVTYDVHKVIEDLLEENSLLEASAVTIDTIMDRIAPWVAEDLGEGKGELTYSDEDGEVLDI